MFWSLKFCGAILVTSCLMFCCCPENFTRFLWNECSCIFRHLQKSGCSVLFCKLSVAGFLTLQNLLSNFSSFFFILAANVRRCYLFSGPRCPSQPTFAWFPKKKRKQTYLLYLKKKERKKKAAPQSQETNLRKDAAFFLPMFSAKGKEGCAIFL